MVNSHDRVKRWALLLLLFNLCIFISVLIAYRHGYSHPLLGYIKAFSEAACVGALADWFAVVALFRHPLGIPLPHTAILPAKKEQLANGIATFIGTHFLDAKVVGEQFVRLKVGKRLYAYVQKNLTEQWIAERLPILLQVLMRQLPSDTPKQFVVVCQTLARDCLTGERLGYMLDRLITLMVEHGFDKKLVNSLAASVHQFATADDAKERIQPWLDDLIREVQKTDLSWWGRVKGQFKGQALEWADDWMIEQVLKWLSDFSEKIQRDDEHFVHLFVSRHIRVWQEHCLLNLDWHDWLEKNAYKFLESQTSVKGIEFVWHKLYSFLNQHTQEKSRYMGFLSVKIREMILNYLSSRRQQDCLNEAAGNIVGRLLSNHQTNIRIWLAEQMKAWSKERLTSALENSIGQDLQYIRINGTLIGGMIGLVLFGITQIV